MAGESLESRSLEVPPVETTATLPRFCGSLGPNSGPKTMWPDLVGLTTGEAEIKIKEDMPGAHIQVVPPDYFVTMDFRPNRVRLYVDESGKVARAPRIG